MAKIKKTEPSIRDKYPKHPRECPVKPLKVDAGSKVAWYTYATRAEAEACRSWALVEAEIKEQQGYDAGYLSPGAIREDADGKFTVVVL